MGNRILKFLRALNPFAVFSGIRDSVDDISENVTKIRELNENRKSNVAKFKEELDSMKQERERERNLFLSVIDHLDDMLWAKDLEGRYIVANKAFRDKFCYGMSWNELQGKTDIELAGLFKEKVGDKNHTFGEVCANSDDVIHDTEKAKKFLEHGKINGKLMKLVVNKSPVYNWTGRMFATCGTGRDITEWHDDLERAIKASNACFSAEGRELLLKELDKLEFKNEEES